MSSINLFSLILAVGAGFGLLWAAATAPKAQRLHWLIAGWAGLLGALLGARIGFVVEHLPYYSRHIAEIPRFWLGGLNWQGALAGGLTALPLIARAAHWKLELVAEHLSRLVLPLGIAGWAGLWWSGLGYGVKLDESFWWGMPAVDESGATALRTPLQPMAIVSLIVFLGVLELWLALRKHQTLRAPLTLLIFSTDMLLLSLLRADPAPMLWGLRIETWLAMIYTLAGILITIKVFSVERNLSFHRKPFQKKSFPTKKAIKNEIKSRAGTN